MWEVCARQWMIRKETTIGCSETLFLRSPPGKFNITKLHSQHMMIASPLKSPTLTSDQVHDITRSNGQAFNPPASSKTTTDHQPTVPHCSVIASPQPSPTSEAFTNQRFDPFCIQIIKQSVYTFIMSVFLYFQCGRANNPRLIDTFHCAPNSLPVLPGFSLQELDPSILACKVACTTPSTQFRPDRQVPD